MGPPKQIDGKEGGKQERKEARKGGRNKEGIKEGIRKEGRKEGIRKEGKIKASQIWTVAFYCTKSIIC